MSKLEPCCSDQIGTRALPFGLKLQNRWLPTWRADAIAAGRGFWKDHSLATAGGGPAVGDSCTGADAADVRGGFGDGGFLAAGGGPAAAAGAVVAGGAERGGGALGSGFMMLTGGVEAAVGNSALVGLPVSRVEPNGVPSPGANVAAGAGPVVVAAACPRPAAADPADAAANAGAAVFHDPA